MPDRRDGTPHHVPPLRWSSVRDCPRKAVLEATREPDRERSDREERILFRGRRIGRDYADFLRAKGEQIETERKVVWPLGVGHIDIYAQAVNTAIEVLSSAHATEEMVHSKLLQVVGYVHHDPDAEHACLVIVDPSDFSEQRIVVTGGSPEYQQLLGEVMDRVAQVIAWRDTGDLPSRVCKKPADAWGHFCLHAEGCFDGWEPEPDPEVDTPEARTLALAFAQAKQHEAAAKAALAAAEESRRRIQAELAELDLAVGDTTIGPYKLKRIHYQGRENFKLGLAKQDSRIPAELLAEFTTVSQPYDVYSIERVSDDAALFADDFGAHPFDDPAEVAA